jgi:uncharacterized protein (TIGR02594 family)
MRKLTGALVALTILACSPALARPHHGRHHAHHHIRLAEHGRLRADSADLAGSGFSLHNPLGSASAGSSLVAEARSQIGKGAVYGRSSLWCARFVNWTLNAVGLHGTGSDLAFSFAHYGRRVPGPQPGAIAVMGRRGGGHVGIVSGVTPQGNPVIISGNHNRRVAEAVYPRGRIVAYVVPN